jgi:hypothetical protein
MLFVTRYGVSPFSVFHVFRLPSVDEGYAVHASRVVLGDLFRGDCVFHD